MPLGKSGNDYFYVDIDKCCDESGNLNGKAIEIVNRLNTYCELSPSGQGVRCILRGGPKIRSVNQAEGVDLFSVGQYVTLTGSRLDGAPATIADAGPELDDLIAQYGVRKSSGMVKSDLELVLEYLEFIDEYEDYDLWLSVGMAMHKVSPDLLSEWKRWSSQCPEKYSEAVCDWKWSTFKQTAPGRSLNYLLQLAEANGYKPDAPAHSISNFTIQPNDKGKTVSVPKSQSPVLREFVRIFGEWPKACRKVLFVPNGNGLRELRNESELFAWMQSQAEVKWNSSIGITKAEFFAAVRAAATEVKYISRIPHYPTLLPNTHYLHAQVQGNSTEELDKLVGLMSPDTHLDAQLIKAAFATVRWSGPPGKRPMFFIQSPDGKGSGKSTLAETIGRVGNRGADGCFTITAKRDFETTTKHIVTQLVTERSVLFLDNHVGRLGGQDIESMVTAREIQGHAMYSGHGSMPNIFTWLVTSNDVQAHEDTADRAVVIKIRRPVYDPAWEDKLRSIDFGVVEEGIKSFFERPKRKLSEYVRWNLWQDEVLSRLDDAEELLAMIRNRAIELSGIDSDAHEIRHRIIERVFKLYGIDPSRAHVFIPSRDLAPALFGIDGRKDFTATSAARYVRPLTASSQLLELDASRDTSRRGFVWRGLNAEGPLRDLSDLRDNKESSNTEEFIF